MHSAPIAQEKIKECRGFYLSGEKVIGTIVAASMLLMHMSALTASHALHGVGQDMESGGRTTERASGK